ATISAPQLLEILRSSPCLETLKLVDNPRLVAIESQPPVTQPIVLSKLVSLTFGWIDHGGTNCILSTIRIPNRRSVFIYGGINDDDARSILFTPAITHILYTTILESDPRFSDIEVEVDESDDCLIRFRGLEVQFWMERVFWVHEILTWMAEGLGSEASTCPIQLQSQGSGVDLDHLAAAPPPLVVRHLAIPAALCDCIASPRQQGSTSSQWLLPHVDSLSVRLDTFESQKQLISMLRGRYRDATLEGETEFERP
ncbi:hypothetical protein FRC01_013350, partial [Tulasnella sp. 417]